eukprot:TRINITY_DN1384_c0_g1_i3.p1 TRINITY_DN1384_c0_g1~~TRINITY_DN1384_c0_g1_i3.p1  ORF type:complete len:267 (-),score=78.31 TRINITY_DN1384_c0_g1_i3:564-1364(-)
MDLIANDITLNRVLMSGHVGIVVTEEETLAQVPVEGVHSGKFAVAIDPLDGSSNVVCNVPTGSIFSIFHRKSPEGTRATLDDVLQPGRDMVCAGYVLYGPAVVYVLSIGKGVHMFTYDMEIGEFVLSREDLVIPQRCKCFSANEGNIATWSPGVQRWFNFAKEVDPATKRPMVGRYVGSLVSDFHRNLLYGGLYAYPATTSMPTGKLRLLYECAPLSFLAAQAGGAGSDGKGDILDIHPTEIHQRVALFLGNTEEVRRVEAFIREE